MAAREKASISDLKHRIKSALKERKADLVIKNVNYLNVPLGKFERSDIAIAGNTIVGICAEYEGLKEIDGSKLHAVPGFIDAHLHVESSLLTPENFDKTVLKYGTTTAICDPHEIANVLGISGIKYFLDSAKVCEMDLFVMLSSCVPATHLETSGYSLSADELKEYKNHEKVLGLAEMMNFPGVIYCDDNVLEKISEFSDGHIDGHSPLLSGDELNAYLSCGIKTCHESTNFNEAEEKLKKGMHILLREGSVSKDVEKLAPLLNGKNWPFIAFCTDDRNPLDIYNEGHINFAIKKAIKAGCDIVDVYRSASWSAANMFKLMDRGVIAPGFKADIVLLSDLEKADVFTTIKNGTIVSDEIFEGNIYPKLIGLKSVKLNEIKASDFQVNSFDSKTPIIGVIENSLLTDYLEDDLPIRGGIKYPSLDKNIQKIAVLERHGKNGNISTGFVKGFSLLNGALASSVGHDSHNICVVGVDDADMAFAVNRLRETGGGFVCVRHGAILSELPLPVAGLMSNLSADEIADRLGKLRAAVKLLGCELEEAFLQLAFLPLPVIPSLKITDMGLVDVNKFEFVESN